MSYRTIYQIENETVSERFMLVVERIRQIPKQQDTEDGFRDYFQRTSEWICLTLEVLAMEKEGRLDNRSLEECEQLNKRLYADVLPENYDASYANPAYAVQKLGEGFGGLLSFLYTECRALAAYAFEGRIMHMTILLELYMEIYTRFCDPQGTNPEEIHRIIYWHFHDYTEITVTQAVRESVDPKLDFFTGIVRNADFDSLTYLYRYGEYITENERRTAQYLAGLPQEQIQAMADTFTEGYRMGFAVTGKDLAKKKSVSIHYAAGFERIVRKAMENFAAMGLSAIIFRDPVSSINGRGHGRRGCSSTRANSQFDYDHRNDSLYLHSSRGYTAGGVIKPDFAAPGVDVYGPRAGGGFTTRTGSSVSAAHAAGASALMMEWAVVRGNQPNISSAELSAYFVRSARRNPQLTYPNREWGYGILDLYRVFEQMAQGRF